MIDIRVLVDNNSYHSQIYVNLSFPAVPRVSDFIYLPLIKERELIRKILKNSQTLNWYRCKVFGSDKKFVDLNDLKRVKEIEWWPNNDDKSMECYITLTSLLDVKKSSLKISEQEYLEILKNTYEVYEIKEES